MLELVIPLQKHIIQVFKEKLQINNIFLSPIPREYKYPFISLDLKNIKKLPHFYENFYELYFQISINSPIKGRQLFIAEKILKILQIDYSLLSVENIEIINSDTNNIITSKAENLILEYIILIRTY
ncbi:MAG: hypothetical protein ISN64_02635 [Rickettsia sp.]|nr:hypothetical protein [Rickettsia sp.]